MPFKAIAGSPLQVRTWVLDQTGQRRINEFEVAGNLLDTLQGFSQGVGIFVARGLVEPFQQRRHAADSAQQQASA